jgi:hypothetical protein
MPNPWTKHRTERTCLGCQKTFLSRGPGHRFCWRCRQIVRRSEACDHGVIRAARCYVPMVDRRTNGLIGFDERLA